MPLYNLESGPAPLDIFPKKNLFLSDVLKRIKCNKNTLPKKNNEKYYPALLIR